MLHLLQLYNKVDDKNLFIGLFSGFNYECVELGYEDDKEELFNEMLVNHFNLELESKKQVSSIVESIVKLDDLSILKQINNI